MANSTLDGSLWDLEPNATSGVFESANLSGSDIAAGLAYANLKFFTSGDVESSFGAGQRGNPFAASGDRLVSSADMGIGSYLKFTFASPVKIGSMKWYTLTGFAVRQPNSMGLQYSNDGSSWNAYATLTNGSKISPATWQNIVRGGTHAAT